MCPKLSVLAGECLAGAVRKNEVGSVDSALMPETADSCLHKNEYVACDITASGCPKISKLHIELSDVAWEYRIRRVAFSRRLLVRAVVIVALREVDSVFVEVLLSIGAPPSSKLTDTAEPGAATGYDRYRHGPATNTAEQLELHS